MPKSSKPRKKYRPKTNLLNPVAFVLESFMPVRAYSEYLTDLRIKNHGALAALVRGQATMYDMNTLMAMSNATMGLLYLGYGEGYEDVAEAGFDSLKSVVERGLPTSRFICKAQEINALNAFMELHDAQMDVITVQDMDRALAAAKAKKMPCLFLNSLKELL